MLRYDSDDVSRRELVFCDATLMLAVPLCHTITPDQLVTSWLFTSRHQFATENEPPVRWGPPEFPWAQIAARWLPIQTTPNFFRQIGLWPATRRWGHCRLNESSVSGFGQIAKPWEGDSPTDPACPNVNPGLYDTTFLNEGNSTHSTHTTLISTGIRASLLKNLESMLSLMSIMSNSLHPAIIICIYHMMHFNTSFPCKRDILYKITRSIKLYVLKIFTIMSTPIFHLIHLIPFRNHFAIERLD